MSIGISVATTALREVPRMEQQAELARRRARRLGRPVLVSVSVAVRPHDPLALFARGVGVTHNRLFWSVPSAGLAVAGLGAAWHVAASGPERFAIAADAWRDLIAHAAIDADPALPFSGPMAAAGFSFDPLRPAEGLWDGYPDGLLLLPRIVLAQVGDSATLTVNGLVGPSSSSISLHFAAARRLRALLGGPWRAPGVGDGVEIGDRVGGRAGCGLAHSEESVGCEIAIGPDPSVVGLEAFVLVVEVREVAQHHADGWIQHLGAHPVAGLVAQADRRIPS